MKNLTDNDSAFGGALSVPEDGVDNRTAASLEGAFQSTGNRTAYLLRIIGQLLDGPDLEADLIDLTRLPAMPTGHIEDEAVTAAKIADAVITVAKLAASAYATAGTPNTLAYRDGAGRMQAVDPSASADVATKNYVDALSAAATGGLTSKGKVMALATTDQTLSGTPTIDGVALSAGQEVLLTNQTDGTENGPWVVAAGSWSRPTNFNSSGEAIPGSFWFVSEGTAYGNTGWWLTTNDTITLGTTELTIAQFSGPGAVQATSPLARSGNTISHETSGVVAGTYTNPSVTVNATGHITGISNGTATLPVAVLVDQKTSGTDAQTLGAWVTRDLNTEVADPSSIVTLASNEFTLGAGTYLIDWSAPFQATVSATTSRSRLYSVTDAAVVQYGTDTGYEDSGVGVLNSLGSTVVVIASGTKTYRIEHNGGATNKGGRASSLGPEIYTQVKILKVG
jgi:hypothetical protein